MDKSTSDKLWDVMSVAACTNSVANLVEKATNYPLVIALFWWMLAAVFCVVGTRFALRLVPHAKKQTQ